MTKENIYLKITKGRRNTFTTFIMNFVQSFSSLPKLLIEVFIRRNMGIRYFNIGAVITVLLLGLLWPTIAYYVTSNSSLYYYYTGSYSNNTERFWHRYTTWFIFLGLFLVMSIFRYREIALPSGTFNFEKFTYYSGDIMPFFFEFPFLKKRPSVKHIETRYEPIVVLIIGITLWLMDQAIGSLLIFSAFVYSISKFNEYRRGDDYVYDGSDTTLSNKHIEEVFAMDDDVSSPHGLRFSITKPTSQEVRKGIARSLVADEEMTVVK